MKFLQIPDIIEEALGKVAYIKEPGLEDLIETNAETRNVVGLITKNRK